MLKSIACGLLLITTLGGCSAIKKPPQPHSADIVVDQALKDASESISSDLALLAGSKQQLQFYPAYGGDLYTPMTLVWDGPLHGALASVASKIGFRLNVEGKEPAVPGPQIHVKCIDKPALRVLREIGMQTGKDVGVRIQEAERAITLVYAGEK